MALDDLPPQRPLRTPEGQAYGDRVMEASRPVLGTHPSLLDQAFGPDYYQRLDVFFPETRPASPPPILVFAHGGSWLAGYKEWMAFMAPAITALPAVFVSASYRLAPDTRFPGPYEDCLDAIAWVYRNAEAIGGDASRLYVGGHSAGGHLMSLAAVRRDDLAARGLPRDLVKGCLAVSAPFDLRSTEGPAGDLNAIQNVLFADLADTVAGSPIVHVTADSPPFVLTFGETDFPRIRDQARPMRDALEAAGVPTVLQELAGHDHFATSERSVEPGHPWLAEAARMLGQP